MDCKEAQQEELEVLRSIYEGDANFKEISENTFQCKVGDNEDFKSFLLEVNWIENYPEEMPHFHLDAFYNKHICKNVKDYIINSIKQEAEQYLGTAMTYTVLEWAKENADDLMKEQSDMPQIQREIIDATDLLSLSENADGDSKKLAERKVQLTKAQKRKMFDRLDNKGERPRGWDWVDLVKHLSQGGSKQPSTPTTPDS